MDDPFLGVRIELANGHKFARDYDEFVSKLLSCITETLNNTDVGQEIMDEALGMALYKHLTPEEWQNQKARFLQAMFFLTLLNCPPLEKEIAHHLYCELRKEYPHE